MLAILFALAAALPPSADLYVSGFFDSSVQRFAGPRSAAPGAAGGTFAKPVARRPWGLAFGPDGALWVANEQGSPAIVRVSGPFSATPGVVETIVDDGAFYDLAFGPDGNLYAAGAGPVRRYDVVTHQLIDEFTHGYALAQTRGIALGPDRNVYVSTSDNSGASGAVLRFDGRSGAFIDVFVPTVAGGPRGLAFAPGAR